MTEYKWPEKCNTCGEPYSKNEPSLRAGLCSSSFHCCRDCVWWHGQVMQPCDEHTKEFDASVIAENFAKHDDVNVRKLASVYTSLMNDYVNLLEFSAKRIKKYKETLQLGRECFEPENEKRKSIRLSYEAHKRTPPYCWRVGSVVDLESNGVCPECGWKEDPPSPIDKFWESLSKIEEIE